MKIKTQDLIGPALDWAVCLANGYDDGWLRRQLTNPNPATRAIPKPSTDHGQGGPIMERERIGTWPSASVKGQWAARPYFEDRYERGAAMYGPTMLIAAMRCYVASRLGDEVDAPEELIAG